MYKYVERVVNNLKGYSVEQLQGLLSDASTNPIAKQVALDMLEAKLIARIGNQHYKETLLKEAINNI